MTLSSQALTLKRRGQDIEVWRVEASPYTTFQDQISTASDLSFFQYG